MEAVPRLPMISFDLKISPDKQPPDFGKLKQYIRDFYHEDPESYNSEIHKLETLRAQAIRPANDVSGCTVLKKYYCQLHYLQSRFPMAKDGPAAVSFTWRDVYGHNSVTVSTIADARFEIVSILYNIGALHSQLGASNSRTDAEGLKMACSHFQCGAWAFQHLKDSYPQPTGSDLAPDLMQFLYQLSLAQAQECILEKSMTDNRKSTIIAKVAAQIVDFYSMALNAISHGGSDESLKETVGTKLYKSWNRYGKFKQTYYGCIALLYQGQQAEEQQKMGERVAYYQAAHDKLTEAIKLSKGLEYPEIIEEALTFTMDVVEGKRKAAKNENEFIYHEEVPDKDSLPEIKGAALVKGTPFCLVDPEIAGPDIFARLVPMKAHEASSLYSEEKAKLLRKIGALIDEKDQELLCFMSSLQLDYLFIHNEPDRLPQELVDRCAAFSAKTDAIQNLINAMDKLSDVYHDVEGMLQEIMHLIKVEEEEEREYQEVMGSRPPSIVATDLTREANKYQEAHNKADESNKTLHKAMSQHIANLRILELPLSELAKQIPNVSVLNLHQDPITKEMQHLVGKVEEMKKQRAMLATQLRESICSDDITALLVTRQGYNLDQIFSEALEKHSKYVSLIEQNVAAQENIIRALSETYAEYAEPKKTVAEIIRQRNMTLSALMSSFDAYEDLIAKSNKGQEFYRKLETNVTKLHQRVKGTCKVQQEERNAILVKNGKTLPSQLKNKNIESKNKNFEVNSPSSAATSGLKLKDYLQSMKAAQSNQPIVNPTPNSYYNPSTITYNNVRVPQTPSPQLGMYADPPIVNESAQPWVPAVRPAPVGSEGTNPSSTKVDVNVENYSSYISQYSSNPNVYPQYPYPTAKAYDHSSDSLPSHYQPAVNTHYSYNYPTSTSYPSSENVIQAKNISNIPLPIGGNYYQHDHNNYHFNSATIASSLPPTLNVATTIAGKNYQVGVSSMNSSYQPAANTVTTNAGQNYQMAASTMNSYQPTINTTTTLAGQNYQMGVSTMNSSFQPIVNTNTTIAGLNYQMNPSTINLNFQPTMDSSSTMVSQGYQVGVSAANSNYLPIMDPTITVSGGSQQTNTSLNYQTIPSGNVSQNYQMGSATNNASYLGQSQNISQSTVYPMSNYQYDLSKSSVMNPNTESYQYSYISPSPSPSHSFNKPEYPAQSSFSEYIPNHYQYNGNYPYNYPEANQGNKNTQVNKNDSHLTQTNQNMAQQQPNAYNYNTEINQPLYGTIPTSLPEAATIKTNYGPISSDIQYTPSSGASFYSHAGHNGSSQTNLTQSAIQGQTSILQNPSQEQMPQYTQGNYYYHPYGYQYSAAVMQSMGSPTVQKMFTIPDSGVQQGPTTPQSPLTYMLASNSNLTMIFSQPTPGSLNNTVADENSSNVDLLAGLDFSLSQAPLVPEQEIESREVKSPKKASIVETEKVVEKLNSLHLNEDQIVQAPQVVLPKKLKDPEEKVSNKTPTKNPFSDPEVLDQFVQEMEKFEKFVETITVKTLNGPTPLDIKWKELLDFQEKDSQNRSISVARCYPVKNRYPDILPYDSSRVELPSTKDDYINASYIKNIVPSFPDYIITQLPLQSTYGDFWTMVLEQQVELIVCLLNDNELNSQVYWPNEKGSDMVVGRLKLTLQSSNICKHWIERIIYVTDTHAARVVVHLQFTQWPGSSFPASPGPFLSLVAEAMSLRTQQRGVGPCVVHCLSGVGRSGLYLLLKAAMCYIQNSHSLPELVTLAGKISTFRKNALRDKEHFKFAYQALLYYTQDLLMKRGILASRSSFVDKRPKTHSRHPSEDFLKSIPKEFDQQLQNEEKDDKDGGSSTCGSEKSGKVDPLSEIDPLWPIKRMS